MDRRTQSTAILATVLLLLGGCAIPMQRAVPEGPAAVSEEAARAADAGPAADTAEAATELGGSWWDEAGLAVEWPETDDAVPEADDQSASPLDHLAVADPVPSPEELEAERERVTAEPPTFDIPMEINDRVLAWVDLYSGRMKSDFEVSLARSGRYLPMFREIFREEGLPQDLVYMAHVESGYKTSAYSRAHARGIFQFISGTARRYGLRVDYWTDERADPEKSARAAAAYMKDLYAEFADWYLALAAYNAGEGKVRRAMARSGRDDFWALARTSYLRRETKNHVPAILAATLLSKEPEKYGLSVERDPAVAYDTIPVEGAADLRVLARCAETDVETLRQLNPALRRMQTPPDGTTDVRVPVGSAERTALTLAAIPQRERILYERHRVRQGDTLSEIASHYGVGVTAIQSVNGMGRRTLIRVNQVLLIPTSAASRYDGGGSVAVAAASQGPRGEIVSYRVRRGDTLYSVSRRYGTSPGAIAAASGIPVNKTLQIGERLTVVRGIRDSSLAAGAAGRTTGAAQSSAHAQVHTVQRGDTLWRIANAYRTSVSALCALNQISPSTILHPGTRLTVRMD